MCRLPRIPVGVPSQLLERRPDIAAAERRAAAANAQIGIAASAFYPTITLGGSGGFESMHGGTWIQGPSALWSLGAQATELLFDAGQRHALTDAARHSYEAQAAGYRSVGSRRLQRRGRPALRPEGSGGRGRRRAEGRRLRAALLRSLQPALSRAASPATWKSSPRRPRCCKTSAPPSISRPASLS